MFPYSIVAWSVNGGRELGARAPIAWVLVLPFTSSPWARRLTSPRLPFLVCDTSDVCVCVCTQMITSGLLQEFKVKMHDVQFRVPRTNLGLNRSTILVAAQEQRLFQWSHSDREQFGKLWISSRQQKRLVKEIKEESRFLQWEK